MPIVAADLVKYSAANRPTTDAATGGGAIDTAWRPTLTQMASTSDIEIVSDGADTRAFTVVYRTAAGAVTTWNGNLNGTTPVALGSNAERVLRVSLGTTDGTRTVTLRLISAGATIATIAPNETGRHIMFQESASEASQVIRYDKEHWKNNHGSLSLLSAQVTLTADPASRIRIGLAAAVNDSVTITNRKTAPGGITFVDDGVAQNVPGTNLASGAAIGVWIEQNLPSNDPAAKSTFTTQLSGQTT